MMSNELVNALTSVAKRLAALATDDDQIRQEVRRLALAVLAATDMPRPDSSAEPAIVAFPTSEPCPRVGEDSTSACGEAAASQGMDESAEPPRLPELTLGRATVAVESPAIHLPARWTTIGDTDLTLLEERLRLKAHGARWAATRRRRMSEGADFNTEIAPGDREIVARARAVPGCLLWMCRPNSPSPDDLRRYDEIAGCYEAVAQVLAVLNLMQAEPDLQQGEFERSLEFLAEAQSALRVAIAKVEGPADPDQLLVFNWLKATTSENQVYIERHMRADDPADPTRHGELLSRVESVDTRLQEALRRTKQRRKAFGKVRHKLSLIASGAPDGACEHWRILAATVDELVRDGLPPSNRELRELLAPALEGMPELSDAPRGFQLVLREVERFLAASPVAEAPTALRTTAEVQAAFRLLEGRSMLLIGGERRPIAEQSLKNAFGLRDLFWITTREHESNDGFEPYIARPEVAVVLLAIRWSSHSYGDVRVFCERHGKPLVRLPAGYNSNQVAAQILEQCSERLRRA